MSANLEKYEYYLLTEKNLSMNSVQAYMRDIKQFVAFCGEMGDVELQLKAFIVQLESQDIAVNSIARKVSAVRSWCQFNGITVNIKLPSVQKPLDFVDYKKILEILEMTADLTEKTFLYLLFTTGCRVSEILTLKRNQLYSCIRDNQLFFTVYGKGDKERVVFISGPLLELLKEYYASLPRYVEFLFPSRKHKKIQSHSHLTRQWAHKVLGKLSVQAGFESIHPHALRHAQAMLLLESGVDLVSIQKILGHAHLSTTERYLRLNWRHLIGAMEKHPLSR